MAPTTMERVPGGEEGPERPPEQPETLGITFEGRGWRVLGLLLGGVSVLAAIAAPVHFVAGIGRAYTEAWACCAQRAGPSFGEAETLLFVAVAAGVGALAFVRGRSAGKILGGLGLLLAGVELAIVFGSGLG